MLLIAAYNGDRSDLLAQQDRARAAEAKLNGGARIAVAAGRWFDFSGLGRQALGLRSWYDVGMKRRIVGYRTDAEDHWVAELECGHGQHVRNDPPWTERPWVTSEEGQCKPTGRGIKLREVR
jgi:hypothetical protein